jgi:uncharacterized protein YggE
MMSQANESKFTLEDEIALLKKRRDELKTISCNIQDIFDWFENNNPKIQAYVMFTPLEFAINEVDVVVGDLKDEIEALEEKLRKEPDK